MDKQGAPARRGRVVMLVDNGVNGDSRVQKAARSAADAGWDVTLVGILGKEGPDRWKIGDAEVRLIPVVNQLGNGYSGRPKRRSLGRPLAYPPGPVAEARLQAVKAWKIDVQTRRAAMTVAEQKGKQPNLLAKARLSADWFAARAAGRWVKVRSVQLKKLKSSRARRLDPLNGPRAWFWPAVLSERSWRRLNPALWSYEIAFGPVIDELKPDLIHANDFRMVGVGARAVLRARAAGRPVKLVYDAHEFVPGIAGRPADPRWLPAQIAYEREFIKFADTVMTVSPTLADVLQETHGLPERPAVVLNAPPRGLPADASTPDVPDLRQLCGVDADTPLLTYCGGVNPTRGIETMIEALPKLPGVHIALVVVHPTGKNVYGALEKTAAEHGVADRVHFVPYVPHWQVAPFLAAADVGVIPILHRPNHEIALITKFFEYSHARLPLVVSDVRTIAETTRTTGQGEVYQAGDVDDYVRAVQAVLAAPERYRAAYDKPGLLDAWTWEGQAEIMDEVYERLVPSGRAS